jgi:hypothetical protein
LRQLRKVSELKSVSGTHKKTKQNQKKKTNVRLPSAVFKTGVLHIHVPSTGCPTKLQITGG